MNEEKVPKQILLGDTKSFASYPCPVKIESETYFLTICDHEYRLLSSVCPHAGGQVAIYQSKLVCPLHMWTFDTASGQCLMVHGAQLEHYQVLEQNGQLIAILP
jgi:anthranilate 1,2-dioxygenase ferredoxin subunit